ncbi:MAG: ABC transporter ATP-binding protein [Rubrobacteraceae bacterium]|jgi:spermidine/putrescine transport system ATP-binding protein|nr:ABC transporter ATP-binding protein [Rubrobacter sp.]
MEEYTKQIPKTEAKPDTKPAVELSGVSKRFGDFTAVDNLDLGIREGEFFSLLGPSGCGKTTTLRMIAGFEDPTEGTLSVAGEEMLGVPPYRRPVNTVFQSYALFPHLDVAENVAFGLKRSKVPKAEIGKRVSEACEMVQLSGFEKRKPSYLSGGQQQRVALARALVNRPKVLLLDEPLGALDLKLRKEMQIELKNLQHSLGITFVYVTHDQEEALTMSDRIAVMDDGRVRQIADPATLYELPADRFVAGFIGETNTFSGEVVDTAKNRAIIHTESGLDIEAFVPDGREVSKGDEAHAAVRPEKVRLGGDGDNVVSGTLRDVVYLGSSTQYIVEIGGGECISLVRQNTRDASGEKEGDEITVAWDAENCLILGG